MKTYLAILCFPILVSISSFAQGDCELTIQTDEFTGAKTSISKVNTLISVFPVLGDRKPWDLVMKFGTVNDTLILYVEHQSQYIASYIFRISIKFVDGSVIIKDKGGKGYSLNTLLGYNNKSTIFLLSKEELIKFSNILIAKVRVEFSTPRDYDPVYEQELKSKKAQPFIDAALCLLKDLN